MQDKVEKLGIIAGNRLLPLLLAQNIKKHNPQCDIVAVCFKGETSSLINNYATRTYWINVGSLGELRQVIKKENLKQWIMAGQISPWRIFRQSGWDQELKDLVAGVEDFRPHNIFVEIINCLQKQGVVFLDSTVYLKDYLAADGLMNDPRLSEGTRKDIEFGVKIISRFVELDVGQTIVVKQRSALALEALEGTDRTIRRGAQLAGSGCTILKFSRKNQDLRFDVPVVGLVTLKLLKRIKAAALVLERKRVIILEKEKFLSLASRWSIPVIGKDKL